MTGLHGTPSPQHSVHSDLPSPTALDALPSKPHLALAVKVLPSPTAPGLTHQSPQTSPGVDSSIFGHPDSVISHPRSPLISYAPSARSTASPPLKYDDRKVSVANSEIEREVSLEKPPRLPPPAATRDAEKRATMPTSPSSESRSRTLNLDIENGYDPYEEPEPLDLQAKALRILIYLSAFCPLVSIAILFWTIVAVFLSIIIFPLRTIISSKLPSLASFLLPPLQLQLRLIYSTLCFSADDERPQPSSTPMILLIHLLCPVIAPLIAVASWTSALFWFFSAVLGDPAGKDGHNDGKAAVLFVRNWWENWLGKGYR